MAVAADMKSTDMLSCLKEYIESNPGIKVKELLGRLKQLPVEEHPKHGTNDSDIRSFLERHSKVFLIDGHDRVCVRRPVPVGTQLLPTDDVTTLCGAEGTIAKVSNVYGFIAVDHPIKASIYFDIQHFEEKSCKDLLSLGLRKGDRVVLDATKTFGHKAKFKATRVSRLAEVAEPANKEGHLYNQCGVIDRVKPGYGFIAFGRGNKDSAFFLHRVVDQAVTKNNKNLTAVFTVGDKVHFDAEPDKTSINKAKWKATKIWCGLIGQHSDSDEDDGEEVFMSEEEEEEEQTKELLSTQQDLHDLEEYPAGRPDWEERPEVFHEPRNVVQSGREDFVEWTSKIQCSASPPACNSDRPSTLTFDASSLKQVKKDKLTLETASAAQLSKTAPSMRNTARQKARANADVQRDLGPSEAEVGTEDEGAPLARATDTVAAEPPVSIYDAVKGTIVRALECIATVKVKEGKVFREIEFTVDCFYKDGEVVLDDLNEILEKGDEVTLDYMVGRSGRKEEVVHCDLLWQGTKPQGVPRLGPKKFLERLVNAGRSARYVVAS